jgi:hypothetical protein
VELARKEQKVLADKKAMMVWEEPGGEQGFGIRH